MTPSFTPTGSGTNDVRQIQAALNRAGGSTQPRLVEDGVMGPKTQARIMEFQRAKGLKPDGIVGPQTRAALGLSPQPNVTPPPFPVPVPVPGGQTVNESAVVNTVVAAGKAAYGAWKLGAMFRAIVIFGPTANGAPGCLTGPAVGPLIVSRLGGLQGTDLAIALAAANGIGKNFSVYQSTITVPGIPWYPAFAAVPGPVAPPTPNIPTPLLSLPSAGIAGITVASSLQSAMEAAAGAALVAKAGSAFVAIAAQLAPFYQQSISTTFVTRVMGTGPVPTFAPPMVPVGPVANGHVLPVPGQLA